MQLVVELYSLSDAVDIIRHMRVSHNSQFLRIATKDSSTRLKSINIACWHPD